jgi:hypothetical protein
MARVGGMSKHQKMMIRYREPRIMEAEQPAIRKRRRGWHFLPAAGSPFTLPPEARLETSQKKSGLVRPKI